MNYLDEYLVKIGAGIDAASFQSMRGVLKDAESAVSSMLGGIAKKAFMAQTSLVGMFLSMGAATIGLADKLAMADQQYRLFGLHMYMSRDRAQALKITLDALGVSMAEAMWDPELHARAVEMLRVQHEMMANFGPGYEKGMKTIRDVRYELALTQIELRYFGMMFITTFLKSIGGSVEGGLKKLREWNAWFVRNMPQLASLASQKFLSVWKEIRDVGQQVWDIFSGLGTIFINFSGILYSAFTGKKGVSAAKFSLRDFGEAVREDLVLLGEFLNSLLSIEKEIVNFTAKFPKLSLLLAGLAGMGAAFGGIGATMKMFSLGAGLVPSLAGTVAGGAEAGIGMLGSGAMLLVGAAAAAALVWLTLHPDTVRKAVTGFVSDVKKVGVGQAIEAAFPQASGFVEWIKGMEGHAKGGFGAYKDIAGKTTVGYGHLLRPGEKVPENSGEASRMLLSDIHKAVGQVESLVKVPLNENQKMALTDFVFNLGPGALRNSSLLRYLNAGDYQMAAREFTRWNKAHVHGRVTEVEALTRRRMAEQALFQAPVVVSPSKRTEVHANIYVQSGRNDSAEDVARKTAREIHRLSGMETQRNLQEFDFLSYGYSGGGY